MTVPILSRLPLLMLVAAICVVAAPVAAAAPAKPAKTTKAAPAKPAKAAVAKTRTSSDVRKDKQKAEKEIADTKKKISANKQKISGQLDRLSTLDNQIQRQEATIEGLRATIDELNTRIDLLRDSLRRLRREDKAMSVQVAKAMRERHVQRYRIGSLPFVMGASSFSDAIQRLNYLNLLQRAAGNHIELLRANRRLIEQQQSELDSVRSSQAAAVKQLATAKEILNERRRESQRVVDNLRSEGASLRQALDDKNRLISRLNAELDRIIAEEARRAEEERRKKEAQKAGSKSTPAKGGKASGTKTPASGGSAGRQGTAAADRKLSGSFAANKGKLLFPVAGRYTIVGTFGRSKHSELSHVQMDNSGIDISVAAGTRARAVFDGTVSSIFFMDGYENIVIVRHGEYLTVYAGLSSIAVKKGDKVKAGQTLGTIATSGGRTVLHFEVRKERTKLNPLQWVK